MTGRMLRLAVDPARQRGSDWLASKVRARLGREPQPDPALLEYDPAAAANASVLFEEIDRVIAKNRLQRDPETERRLLRLRHLAAIRSIAESRGDPEYAAPAFDQLPGSGPLIEVPATELTPGLIRAGILRHGCLLVRRLVDPAAALRFAELIDDVFAQREECKSGGSLAGELFDEFTPTPAMPDYHINLAYGRVYINACCGISASDSPLASFEMFEMYRAAGLPELIAGYLGETPLISVEKTTLRKAEPSVGGAWHQDGFFMGESRAVNMWLAFSHCGDDAPGLDIVPRRLDHYVRTQTDEALLHNQISQQAAEEAADGTPVLRPIFEPGDALFFDGMLLHQTGSDPSMSTIRFGIENWFIGASRFPENFTPIAI